MSATRSVVMLIATVSLGVATVIVVRDGRRQKEVMWAINADLHNIATAQEAYFSDNNAYATWFSPQQYRPMNGAVVRIVRADATSWEATATHPGTALTCTSTTVRKVSNWWPPVCK